MTSRATERLHEIARAAAWWPSACKLAIPPGVTEQSEFFAAMAADPLGWAERVRAGVGAIADRLAWANLSPIARKLAAAGKAMTRRLYHGVDISRPPCPKAKKASTSPGEGVT